MLPAQAPCVVFLHVDGGRDGSSIEIPGLVLRHELHTLPIQLIELKGRESAHLFRNLVLYYSGTQVGLADEKFETQAKFRPTL
jgi:hypothetical protein